MMKVHLRVFVEVENLGKIMNILSDKGVTGFYIVEYKGISPQEWQGFAIKEDPKSAISVIRDSARDAILVCSVLDEERVDPIISEIAETLKNERYTVIEVPIRRIVVNSPKS
jgi:nitrogen regulatory protein PII-like uncharacterized protein